MKGGFYFLNLNIKYSFRVDRGWTLDVGIILAVLSAPSFFASAAQSYSGRRRRGRGRYTRASQRPRSSHARSALINHDGPARKKGGKKKFVAIIWRRARSKLGLFSLFTEWNRWRSDSSRDWWYEEKNCNFQLVWNCFLLRGGEEDTIRRSKFEEKEKDWLQLS